MRGFLDTWIDVQAWLFDTIVGPGLYRLGLMEWYEPAFNAVEMSVGSSRPSLSRACRRPSSTASRLPIPTRSHCWRTKFRKARDSANCSWATSGAWSFF